MTILKTYLIISLLIFPALGLAYCPCFNENDIYHGFKTLDGPVKGTICTTNTTYDKFGMVETRAKTTIIVGQTNQEAGVVLVEQASVREFSDRNIYRSGRCERKNVLYSNKSVQLENPQIDYFECSNIILNACRKLNAPIIPIKSDNQD